MSTISAREAVLAAIMAMRHDGPQDAEDSVYNAGVGDAWCAAKNAFALAEPPEPVSDEPLAAQLSGAREEGFVEGFNMARTNIDIGEALAIAQGTSKAKPVSDERDILDSQDFNEMMYAYRRAPAHLPSEVVARFEEVKTWIRAILAEQAAQKEPGAD